MTDSKRENGAKVDFDAKDLDPYLLKDPEAMAMNFARALENLGRAASAWLGPRERGEISDTVVEPVTDMVKTLSKVTDYWISDPRRTFEAQTQLMSSFFGIWMNSVQRMQGSPLGAEPIARVDKRFADEDWQKIPSSNF